MAHIINSPMSRPQNTQPEEYSQNTVLSVKLKVSYAIEPLMQWVGGGVNEKLCWHVVHFVSTQ